MLTFSKESWHYRFADMVSTRYDFPSNLCPYVRRVMGGMALFSFVALLAGIFLVWNIGGLFLAFNGLWLSEFGGFQIINSITAILLSGAAVNYSRERYDSWRAERRRIWTMAYAETMIAKYGHGWSSLCTDTEWTTYCKGTPAKDAKQPGLIRAYFKAMHDKVCPSLSFVTSKEPLDSDAV